MTEYRRPFSVTQHGDDGYVITVGNRHLRINQIEADELVSGTSGRPLIQRHVVGER
jgi:hypothetical protein